MASRSLNSDQLNYLIWRYLQESGYAEAAVKLQRDWKHEPQGLPFHSHIQSHALVGLVQKGLLYHEVECSLDRRGNPLAGPIEGFFHAGSGSDAVPPPQPPAPSSGLPVNQQQQQHAAPVVPPTTTLTYPSSSSTALGGGGGVAATVGASSSSSSSSPRKHPRDSVHLAPSATADLMLLDPQNQPPATKRSRKSHEPPTISTSTTENGITSTTAQPTANGDAMLLDDKNHFSTSKAPAVQPFETAENLRHSPKSRSKSKSPTPPLPKTNGASVGTQVDKVADVGAAETARLLDTDSATVLHAHWHPLDPSLLVTAGTDALARIWKIPAAPDHEAVSVNLDLDIPSTSYITAIAWDPDGEFIAVAPRSSDGQDRDGQIIIRSKKSGHVDSITVGKDPLISLKWSPKGTCLLGASSSISSQRGRLYSWSAERDVVVDCKLEGVIGDVAWISEDVFAVCTHNTIIGFSVVSGRAAIISKTTPPLPPSISPEDAGAYHIMRYDKHTDLLALGTEDCELHLYRSTTFLHRLPLDSPITSLEWQPLSPPTASPPKDEPRILALALDSGAVLLMNGCPPYQTVHSLLPPSDFPAQAIAFTHDGFAIATKSAERVLVWNVASGGLPKAVWMGTDEDGTALPKREIKEDGSDVDLGGTVSLDWDANGRRLVVAEDRSVAIVRLGR